MKEEEEEEEVEEEEEMKEEEVQKNVSAGHRPVMIPIPRDLIGAGTK